MLKTTYLATVALIAGAGMAAGCGAAHGAARGPQFSVSFTSSAHSGPITGRVFIMLTRHSGAEPRLQVGGYNGDIPFFGQDVDALAPGHATVVGPATMGNVVNTLGDLPAGDYYAQALMNVYTEFPRADGHTIWAHMDQWQGQQFNLSAGNLVSAVQHIHVDPSQDQTFSLTLDRVLPHPAAPADTAWVKRVKMQSAMLTKFWGHPIYMGATVLLPAGYDQHPQQRYPVVYIQGHFSLRAPYGFTTENTPVPPQEAQFFKVLGLETGYQFYQDWIKPDFPKMILVTLQHPTPFYDDSYAVNSVNSGPYGDAILQELIPYVEKHFRIIGTPGTRMLTGGSTGGWESLDLEVKHPDFFGGTWTFYPDPLDFHHFQMINLYDDNNAFRAPGMGPWVHTPRYTNRQPDGQPLLTVEQMSRAEAVEGTHGRSEQQFDVFFAAFGPMGSDGYPVPLWDLTTGAINKQAVTYARDHGYDITAYLRQNWPTLGPKLVNRIHVYVGDMDTYYLNLGVYDLQAFMETTQNPHYAGTFVYGRPEKPHGWNGGMTQAQLLRQIAAAVRR
ncbi:MAG: alpha/beta hydrolase-fold protein [Terriglobales bacterium]